MVKLKVATALEMMTIVFPGYFLAMGSAANSIKVFDELVGWLVRTVERLLGEVGYLNPTGP